MGRSILNVGGTSPMDWGSWLNKKKERSRWRATTVLGLHNCNGVRCRDHLPPAPASRTFQPWCTIPLNYDPASHYTSKPWYRTNRSSFLKLFSQVFWHSWVTSNQDKWGCLSLCTAFCCWFSFQRGEFASQTRYDQETVLYPDRSAELLLTLWILWISSFLLRWQHPWSFLNHGCFLLRVTRLERCLWSAL